MMRKKLSELRGKIRSSRKKVAEKIRSGRKKIVRRISKLRQWAFENWVRYILLKHIFFLLIVYCVLLTTINEIFGWLITLPFLSLPLFFLLDSKRISVAEKNPAQFVKAEKIERFFEILFYVLYFSWIPFMIIIVYSEEIGLAAYLPSIQWFWIFTIASGLGLFVMATLNTIEYSNFLKKYKEKRVSKAKWHWFEFYPLETLRAKARFVILADFLSNNPSRKAISRKISLFRKGLKIYNDHLKADFDIAMCEPKRFYNKAKLATFSSDKKDDLQHGLEYIIELLSDKKEEPLEIVKAFKEMFNEQSSFNDVCREIDVEPRRIRKWVSSHYEHIGIIIPIVLFMVQIALYMLKVIPSPF